MRYAYALLLSLLILSPAFAQHTNKGYVITGTVKGLNTGTACLVFKDAEGKPRKEEARINHGRFKFTGSVTEPQHCYIGIDGQLKEGEFFVENAKIRLSFDKNSPGQLMVKGSPATDLFLSFQNREKSISKDYAKLSELLFTAKQRDDLALKQYADSVQDILNTRHRKYLREFVKANYKSPVAEYLLLRALTFDNDVAGISNIFAMLDPSLANTPTGNVLAGKLQLLMDVASEKTDSEADPVNKTK